ncbi:RHOMBOID-like protein 9, chloroplastic isoform X2 [Senna tora]|uniref:RHOMBOID-like protein 9, chloroplastic isoform X2 n=1 Tax=Senna tora TaxID=362788 RepID=A0A834T7C6_9FABA|nr:RHOMBOID-like protein 9, chloroplastic isoform X2 [Senna tora]
MAAFLLCHKTVYKDQNLPIQNITRQNDKRPMYDFSDLQRSFFSKSNVGEEISPRCLGHAGCFLRNTTTRGTFLHRFYGPAYNLRFIQGCCYSDKDRFSTVSCSSESGTNEKHLRALDAYFGKLQDNVKAKVLSPLDSSPQVMQECHKEGEAVSKKGLESLDAYLAKLNNDTNLDSLGPSTYNEHYNEDIIRKETERDYYRKQNTYVSIRRTKGERGLPSSGDTIQQDEASSLYLVKSYKELRLGAFFTSTTLWREDKSIDRARRMVAAGNTNVSGTRLRIGLYIAFSSGD